MAVIVLNKIYMSRGLRILVVILTFMPLAFAKAECSLNLNNLSINNQSNSNTADIVRLQSMMFVNDLYDGPITGYYGKLTEKAVNNFKADNGLVANGIVDKNTINLICNNYSSCPLQSTLEKNDEFPVKEIKFLQSFLRLIPNIYPEKLVTGFYGTKTENAVKRLQTKLRISATGKIDGATRSEFCNYFNELDSEVINVKSETISSIFQSLCLAFPQSIETGKTALFISQILGGNAPYKYIWNNKTSDNDKTAKYSFNKAGDYTINLKVIDSKGKISTANCGIKVTGETVSGNELNLDVSLNQESDLNVKLGDNTTTTKANTGKIGSSFDAKVFYQSVEKYINNPVRVDAEVLPVEIVKGDPIKINIINIPNDLKRPLLMQWPAQAGKKLKAYWTGDDIINQSLDRIVLNSNWYSNMNNGAVPIIYKSHSIFANRINPYGPKTRGWFELPSEKLFLGGGNGTAGSFMMKGYNPKDDWAIYQKGLYVDYADLYYSNNVEVKKEIANYFVFNRSGNYLIRFNIYFTSPNDSKEYLVAYSDINLKVIDKPIEGSYAKVYITPGASKVVSSCEKEYTNSVPDRTSYPYRDLDGKFIGFDWQHMFVDTDYIGGGIWNYLNLTNVLAPKGMISNLIFGQEGLFKDWEKLFSIGTLGSSFYRAFQSDPEDLFYVNGRDPVVTDKNMCATWYNVQTKIPVGQGYGASGGGFTKTGIYLDNPAKIEGAQSCRGVCFQTVDLPDVKKPVSNNRSIDTYIDLVIKDYKMESIDSNGMFNMKYLVRNNGKVDFKVDDYTYPKVVCKNGNEAGTDLSIIHSVSKKTYKVDYGVTITKDIKAESEVWISSGSKQYCPVGTVMAGCIVDPSDVVDEKDEKNNYIRNVRIDCDMPTTTTTLPNTTVTTKQTSKGTMYNLLTYGGQINVCNNDNDCTVKNGSVYCTHIRDGAPVTPNTFGVVNVYFDKDCKCVGGRCQAIAK